MSQAIDEIFIVENQIFADVFVDQSCLIENEFEIQRLNDENVIQISKFIECRVVQSKTKFFNRFDFFEDCVVNLDQNDRQKISHLLNIQLNDQFSVDEKNGNNKIIKNCEEDRDVLFD